MFRWTRKHWKFLLGLLLGFGVATTAVLLFLFFPPALPVFFAVPLLGALIVTMPQALAAATLGVTAFVMTLSAVAAYNVVYNVTRFLDWLITPVPKKRLQMDELDNVDNLIDQREAQKKIGQEIDTRNNNGRKNNKEPHHGGNSIWRKEEKEKPVVTTVSSTLNQ